MLSTKRQQLEEAVPPYQTSGERSNNASSGPPSLFLVFLAENSMEIAIVKPLSPDWFNYLSNKNLLSEV